MLLTTILILVRQVHQNSHLNIQEVLKKEDANGTLEFRLGSTTGPLIAKASIENTGTWQNWKEVTIDTARITGVQNVYIVFKSDTSYVCNFVTLNLLRQQRTIRDTFS